jgi:hypothetical protein
MVYVIASPGVQYSPEDIAKLETERKRVGADIVCAGTLIQHWSNGAVRKVLNFESGPSGSIHPEATSPPIEPEAYARERWNPFWGLAVVRPELEGILQPLATDPTALLAWVRDQRYNAHVLHSCSVHSFPVWSWRTCTPRGLVRHSQMFRNCILHIRTALKNLYNYWNEGSLYRAHYEAISDIKRRKILILDLEFGGLGDCLSYSTLPRQLKEKFDIDFYLSERSRTVIRNPDFARIVFEMNPYFKGYHTGPSFFPRVFLRDASWFTILTGRGGRNAVAEIERQFGLTGTGNPELPVKLEKIHGYEKVLLCDQNWHTGKKLGLYNDPTLLENVLAEWRARGEDYRIEYANPNSQDLFTYIQTLYSCGQFVCFLSGGNSLAAALGTAATVVLPENVEGGAITQFLFLHSPIRYLRRRPLRGVSHAYSCRVLKKLSL